MDNFFSLQNLPSNSECVEILAEVDGLRVERIVSNSAESEKGFWYNQDEDEKVWVLQGEAQIEFENEVKTLMRGDGVFIKKHTRHRVKSTSENCIWLAIFSK